MSLLGANLIDELKECSGLDSEFFDHQMSQILKKYSIDPENLALDQLRDVLSDYLQALILEDEVQKVEKRS